MKISKKENATNKLQNKQKTFEKGVYINKATTSSLDKNIFGNQFSSEESSDSLLMNNITVTAHPYGDFTPILTIKTRLMFIYIYVSVTN